MAEILLEQVEGILTGKGNGCDLMRGQKLAEKSHARVHLVDEMHQPIVDEKNEQVVLNEGSGIWSIVLEVRRNLHGGLGHVKPFHVQEPEVPPGDDYCLERAMFLEMGLNPTLEELESNRKVLNNWIRSKMKDWDSQNFTDFINVDRFGLRFTDDFMRKHGPQADPLLQYINIATLTIPPNLLTTRC